MLLCTKCGSEELNLHTPVAVPAKTLPKSKRDVTNSWQWSLVSQRICPICGSVHVNICCDRNK